MSSPEVPDLRIGTGVDVHAFGTGVPMWVAGLEWPEGGDGLAGHSDGDVVAHAVADALLAAAGLGDLGSVIGVDAARWAGAHGTEILAEVATRLADAGWIPVNASVQLIGAHPRLGERRAEAEAVLTAAIGAPVSVGATTTDGLGFTGRGEGLAAIATALVRRRGDG